MASSETGRITVAEASKAKIDAVFAQRSRTADRSQDVQLAQGHSSRSLVASSNDATRTKVDAVFALRTKESNGLAKIDAIFGRSEDVAAINSNSAANPDAPRQERHTNAAISGQSAQAKPPQSVVAHPDLAQNDWARMTAADVAATAAFAVSKFRNAAEATAFMIKRASDPAFRKALAPEGLQPGQTFSDICAPAIKNAMADRGWS